MDIVLGGRQTGRTSALINFLDDQESCTVLVPTSSEIKRLEREVSRPGDHKFVTPNLASLMRGSDRPLVIDDADRVLTMLLDGVRPSLITVWSDGEIRILNPPRER